MGLLFLNDFILFLYRLPWHGHFCWFGIKLKLISTSASLFWWLVTWTVLRFNSWCFIKTLLALWSFSAYWLSLLPKGLVLSKQILSGGFDYLCNGIFQSFIYNTFKKHWIKYLKNGNTCFCLPMWNIVWTDCRKYELIRFRMSLNGSENISYTL